MVYKNIQGLRAIAALMVVVAIGAGYLSDWFIEEPINGSDLVKNLAIGGKGKVAGVMPAV
ncbi:hypothetical protein LAV78_16050 [Brucella intermedia]|uniref:hypothetical protein n=1 Tax=Brucella intermedia TaxID=94625 RepID=UPI001E5B9864|nr:hypothetical protein [Brucella intermedia]MCB4920035.1 hypothetical protein [Brucella intermedia]